MDDVKRGDDAADHAPKSEKGEVPGSPQDTQDAANYDDRTDGGRALETDDVSSANDQGAG